jgi:hypothetical protein
MIAHLDLQMAASLGRNQRLPSLFSFLHLFFFN